MFWEADVVGFFRWIDYAVGALFQCRLELYPIRYCPMDLQSRPTKGIMSAGWVVSLCANSSS